MLISTSRNLKIFEPVQVSGGKDLLRIVKGNANYSLATFKDNERTKANFVQCEAIGLDIDEGMTLDEAKEAFKKYRCIITTTKSHRKEKNGVVADRFRVLISLAKPITDEATYYATWAALQKEFPAIDPACKDPSRFYYPSPADASTVQFYGDRFEPVAPSAEPVKEPVQDSPSGAPRGRLSNDTCMFLLEGAPKGSRHTSLFKAAIDAHEQGYPKSWFIDQMDNLYRRGVWTAEEWGEVLFQISDIFSREPKHEPRIEKKAVSFKKLGDLKRDAKPMNWVVEGLLYEGGLSILAGEPKIGKSTIVKQITKAFLHGQEFLGRKVTKGPVLYLALEEQEALLVEQMKQVGINDNDELYMHVGSLTGRDPYKDLEEAIEQTKPVFMVVDTMLLMLRANDMNNYNEMNAGLEKLRNLARTTGVHILMIHHRNKSQFDGFSTISGSQAIHGAVDCAIMFRKGDGTNRIVSSSQRGGQPFDNVELRFDSKTQSYSFNIDEEFGK